MKKKLIEHSRKEKLFRIEKLKFEIAELDASLAEIELQKKITKQSAFQKWDNSEPVNPDPLHNENWHRRRGRKEGWNAAVNTILSRITDVEDNDSPMLEIAGYFRKSFKELIEND